MVGFRLENIPIANIYLVCYNVFVNDDKPLDTKGEQIMNKVVETFMRRDGMTESEAKREYMLLREDVLQAAEDGMFEEAEDIMLCSGFELDYIADLLI